MMRPQAYCAASRPKTAHDRADHGLRAVPRRAGQRHHAAGAGAGRAGGPALSRRALRRRGAADRMVGRAATPGAACWPRSRPISRCISASPRAPAASRSSARPQCLRGDAGCARRPAAARRHARRRRRAPAPRACRCAHIVARLRRRGIPAFVSRDAGAYLCNAALYHSLRVRAGRGAAAAASASCTSRRGWPGPAAPIAAAPAPARSPGSRPWTAGWRFWPRASDARNVGWVKRSDDPTRLRAVSYDRLGRAEDRSSHGGKIRQRRKRARARGPRRRRSAGPWRCDQRPVARGRCASSELPRSPSRMMLRRRS